MIRLEIWKKYSPLSKVLMCLNENFALQATVEKHILHFNDMFWGIFSYPRYVKKIAVSKLLVQMNTRSVNYMFSVMIEAVLDSKLLAP